MKTLVLDKSSLRAAPTQFLLQLRESYDFLLTGALLQEVGTRDVDKRTSMPKKEKRALNRKIEAQFAKAVKVAGNEWHDHLEALDWEITEGKSARFMPGLPLREPLDLDRFLDDETVQDCLAFDDAKASFASFAAPVRNEEDEKVLARFMQTPEEDFFCRLTHQLASDTSSKKLRKTMTRLTEAGEERGRSKSPYLFPRRDWLVYGIALTHSVYLTWKLWKYGNEAPHKAANAAYDLYYIAFMAIADGILSSDKNMLKLAWAVWPDKRKHIYEYHDERIDALVPLWSSTSDEVDPEEPLPFL